MTECNPSALLENAQFGCWSAEYNTEVLKRRTELSLQNSEQDQLTLKDPTGRFLEDYMKACGCIGVVPHPEIIRHAKTTDELSEDQDAIQSLRVFGWTLDLGTATALAQTFPACTTLSCLRLWNAGLTPEVVRVLGGAFVQSNLTHLYLDWNPFTSELDASCLASLCTPGSHLRVLSMRGNGLTDAGVLPLLEAVGKASCLTALNLGSNYLTDASAEVLAGVLRYDRALVSLSLAHNLIGDCGIETLLSTLVAFPLTPEEAKERTKFLPRAAKRPDGPFCTGNSVLKNLVVSYGILSDKGAAAAEAALEENTTLVRLALMHNNFSRTTLKRLSSHPRILVERLERSERNLKEPKTPSKAQPIFNEALHNIENCSIAYVQ